jgi:F-type H+-transporting ATPase subunit gamma
MLSTRDIQRKIRTVRNIQQICRAMKTVSSIKLRKAEERIHTARPYAEALRTLVSHLGGSEAAHPLLEPRPVVHRTGILAISSDKGLAGSYNANLIREALLLARRSANPQVIPIGRKITDAFRRTGLESAQTISPLGTAPEFRTFAALADYVGELYSSGQWDQVFLVFTQFGGGISTQQLLPIQPPTGDEVPADAIFEPSADAILAHLLPRYLRTLLYTAVLSSVAAEHAARVAAMALATENAEELIAQLTMDYNKSRQAAITTELGDIVSAAEALR